MVAFGIAAVVVLAGLAGWTLFLLSRQFDSRASDWKGRIEALERSREFLLDQVAVRKGVSTKTPDKPLRAYVRHADRIEYMDGISTDFHGNAVAEDNHPFVSISGVEIDDDPIFRKLADDEIPSPEPPPI